MSIYNLCSSTSLSFHHAIAAIRPSYRRVLLCCAAAALFLPASSLAQWQGLADKSQSLNTASFTFGLPIGGNKNYYDGDFADFDNDGRADRILGARFGNLWNRGGGYMIPVSSQRSTIDPNGGLRSLSGFEFRDTPGTLCKRRRRISMG